MDLSQLRQSPNALAPHYSRFRVAERLLLTGHSHQAWPDCAREGQLQAFDEAAAYVDGKWPHAFAKAERVARGLAERIVDPSGSYALADSTHSLLVKWLSALPWRERRRIVTTDGEFHALRRQLARLEEEGIEVVRVPSRPSDGIAEGLAAAVDDRTAAVMVSAVLFRSAEIVPGLERVLAAAQRVGAELMIDAYHVLNVVPFPLAELGLEDAFVVGGGYKYLQIGEGNAFLRVPRGRDLRPVFTGWFAEFAALSSHHDPLRVAYGPGASAFGAATYDPTSQYRAAAVFDFFDEQGLTVPFLRQVSQHQVGLLARLFDDLDLPPGLISRERDVPLERIGGFLALTSPRAGEISAALARRGVATDYRDTTLRLGPAPYLSDRQIEEAMGLLGEAVREVAG
ncbi:MAG TPA: kynureninase [Thermoanaerobaculia bacterium]|nr:kynureninase [Thermoanaerobaculia bacterium]